jgi:hypothetical protein
MLRELYVDTLNDRVMTGAILIALVVFYVVICWVLPVWSEMLTGIASLLILLTTELLVFFLHRDLVQEASDDTEEYTSMIANIEDVGKKLSNLALFLRRERERVEASEATLKRLRSEHSELEPVVKADRRILDVILAANAKATATASRAWKERALAFMTGVITSLLASALYDLFRGKL